MKRYLILFLTALIFLIFLSANALNRANFERYKDENEKILIQNISQKVNSWTQNKLESVKIAANSLSKAKFSDKNEAKAMLVELPTRLGFKYLMLGLEDKTFMMSDPAFITVPTYDARTRGWYKQTINEDGAIITKPYLSMYLAAPVISFCKTLELFGEKGAICAGEPIGSMQEYFLSDSSLRGRAVAIMDEDGVVVSSLNTDSKFSLNNSENNFIKIKIERSNLYLMIENSDEKFNALMDKNLIFNVVAFVFSLFICSIIYVLLPKNAKDNKIALFAKERKPTDTKEISEDENKENQSENEINPYIEKTLFFIDENLADNGINIDKITKISGYSKYHFQRVFKDYAGENAASYIRMLRLNQASMLLKYGDDKIADIALKCGFSYEHTFIRAFEKIYQKTPDVYRTSAIEEINLASAIDDEQAKRVNLDKNLAFIYKNSLTLKQCAQRLATLGVVDKNCGEIILLYKNAKVFAAGVFIDDGLNLPRVKLKGEFMQIKADKIEPENALIKRIYASFFSENSLISGFTLLAVAPFDFKNMQISEPSCYIVKI